MDAAPWARAHLEREVKVRTIKSMAKKAPFVFADWTSDKLLRVGDAATRHAFEPHASLEAFDTDGKGGLLVVAQGEVDVVLPPEATKSGAAAQGGGGVGATKAAFGSLSPTPEGDEGGEGDSGDSSPRTGSGSASSSSRSKKRPSGSLASVMFQQGRGAAPALPKRTSLAKRSVQLQVGIYHYYALGAIAGTTLRAGASSGCVVLRLTADDLQVRVCSAVAAALLSALCSAPNARCGCDAPPSPLPLAPSHAHTSIPRTSAPQRSCTFEPNLYGELRLRVHGPRASLDDVVSSVRAWKHLHAWLLMCDDDALTDRAVRGLAPLLEFHMLHEHYMRATSDRSRSQREVALDIYDRFFRANHEAGGAPDAGAAASTAAVCSFVAPAALAAIHMVMGKTRCGVRVSDDLPIDRTLFAAVSKLVQAKLVDSLFPEFCADIAFDRMLEDLFSAETAAIRLGWASDQDELAAANAAGRGARGKKKGRGSALRGIAGIRATSVAVTSSSAISSVLHDEKEFKVVMERVKPIRSKQAQNVKIVVERMHSIGSVSRESWLKITSSTEGRILTEAEGGLPRGGLRISLLELIAVMRLGDYAGSGDRERRSARDGCRLALQWLPAGAEPVAQPGRLRRASRRASGQLETVGIHSHSVVLHFAGCRQRCEFCIQVAQARAVLSIPSIGGLRFIMADEDEIGTDFGVEYRMQRVTGGGILKERFLVADTRSRTVQYRQNSTMVSKAAGDVIGRAAAASSLSRLHTNISKSMSMAAMTKNITKTTKGLARELSVGRSGSAKPRADSEMATGTQLLHTKSRINQVRRATTQRALIMSRASRRAASTRMTPTARRLTTLLLSSLLQPCFTLNMRKPTYLTVLAGWKTPVEPMDVVFPTAAARQKFAGRLRGIERKLDAVDSEGKTILNSGTSGDELSIFIGTWNVADTHYSSTGTKLGLWIPAGDHDMIVVTLQENKYFDEWKDAITLHIQGGADNPLAMQLIAMEKLMFISIFVFARSSVVKHLHNVAHCKVATGLGNVLGNKGGCIVTCQYKQGGTRLCFVGCHLAAGAAKAQVRSLAIDPAASAVSRSLTPHDAFRSTNTLTANAPTHHRPRNAMDHAPHRSIEPIHRH